MSLLPSWVSFSSGGREHELIGLSSVSPPLPFLLPSLHVRQLAERRNSQLSPGFFLSISLSLPLASLPPDQEILVSPDQEIS
jgi:hypothetical protein